MVVVNCRSGQCSNRLVVAAHAMSVACERGESLLLTALEEYKEDYVCKACGGMQVVVRDSRFWECVRMIDSAMKNVFRYKCLSIPQVFTLASDWHFRDTEALSRH